ncbi:hypothetical protein BC834DRAFT_173732 [Gloeopeniophorella convolvens]|nr:hypothetical protein BC834DRAFT_173732 [Gloeopeniophorella convolvens]
MPTASNNTGSPATSQTGLFSKIFRKGVSQTAYPYENKIGRDSSKNLSPSVAFTANPTLDVTLVGNQPTADKGQQRDPDAAFGSLASTYGWGVGIPAPLPSERKDKKKSASKQQVSSASISSASTPSTPYSNAPRQPKLTQAQREQAIVDLTSQYGWASTVPSGRWRL